MLKNQNGNEHSNTSKETIASSLVESCGLNLKLFEKCRFSNFTNDIESMQKVRKYLNNFSRHKKDGTGLYLWSPTPGVGKTHLLYSTARVLLKGGIIPKYLTLSELVTGITESWYNKGELISSFGKGVIILDDISSELIDNPLYAKAITYFIKSNQFNVVLMAGLIPPSELKTISPQLESILRGKLAPIKVGGQDKRKKVLI